MFGPHPVKTSWCVMASSGNFLGFHLAGGLVALAVIDTLTINDYCCGISGHSPKAVLRYAFTQFL